MNNLSNIAIVAEFISDSNIKLIQKLLEEKNCYQLTLFLEVFQAHSTARENDRVKVSIFPSNTARERGLEKLKNTILAKRVAEENKVLKFTEEEVSEIFASTTQIKHFDLIILASSKQNSLANNFITDASYAEFYLSNNIYNEDFFDINEITSAVQAYENSQRNFGS
jgi:undecaprenyl diphosphate synthase